ncbi:helix-turn-helix transcriptional regulator [Paenibacillus sp. GCM10027627]|uniref:helix-turn-helix transcriptional regulator n=1 Tax=unclassified Paenibacillus TaxID=185978 RepID=UPI00362FFBFB
MIEAELNRLMNDCLLSSFSKGRCKVKTTASCDLDHILTYIHQHLYEPLTLAGLAAKAAYSPYHFTRLFKLRMGISPLYYISALRLQKAKDLLLRTNYSVRDIGMEIGQQSLGTFTTRFTERVGMTPTQFRNSGGEASRQLEALRHLENWQPPSHSHPYNTTIRGTVRSDYPLHGVVLIGLFPKPIPEGFPLYGTLISSLGDFELDNVEPGIYYIMATTISWGTGAMDMLLPQETLRTRSREPFIVTSDREAQHVDVSLFPPSLSDPPILISLPLLMNQFLERFDGGQNMLQKG